MRRGANEGLNTSSVKGFYETQMTEAVLLACHCLVEPAQWDRHLRRAAASMTLSALYGHPTLTSEQDDIVAAINDLAKRLFRAASLGAYWVQIFPWLRHVPSRWVLSTYRSLVELKV